jgi:hypothetical protein
MKSAKIKVKNDNAKLKMERPDLGAQLSRHFALWVVIFGFAFSILNLYG